VKRVFVDTGAWIALTDQSDAFHTQAHQIADHLKNLNTLLVTSDYVLDETITWLRYHAGHQVAAEFADQVMSSQVTEVIYIDENVFSRTVALFRKYKDQKFSFTDCSSFALMQTHRIKQAFAFDAHFTTAGFELLK
jgi:predicted nucleic acid-binding protein